MENRRKDVQVFERIISPLFPPKSKKSFTKPRKTLLMFVIQPGFELSLKRPLLQGFIFLLYFEVSFRSRFLRCKLHKYAIIFYLCEINRITLTINHDRRINSKLSKITIDPGY